MHYSSRADSVGEAEAGAFCASPFRLALIIPAYNEEETIEQTIATLRALTPDISAMGGSIEIIVVNDGSKDETGLRAAQADHIITHHSNRGLGASVRDGLAKARLLDADIALKLDADLQHDPADIPNLIRPILRDEADIVFGHRHARIEYRMPFVRRVGNKFYNWMMSKLTGWPIVDAQPGIIALNRRYLSAFDLPGNYNYAQQILLDSRYRDLKFSQVDVNFRKRRHGSSFITFRYPLLTTYQILVVIALYAPIRVFGRFGLALSGLAASIAIAEIVLFLLNFTSKPVIHPNLVLALLFLGIQSLFFSILAEIVRTRRS
ncbi:hypothetical protein K32_01660 [Kaistia sp. 32K]|uniref:glycosyltransferase family 2 protein n=1 Tax=Kaistia sp. 32K TaxID=2795690 RepID=UPI001914FB1F|nr:glycosyltransferase family 2 protein [Kaistia sp. 32K]BCP51549.1 hypothetical protein K32_01660 [Kaistia sp. 32K]